MTPIRTDGAPRVATLGLPSGFLLSPVPILAGTVPTVAAVPLRSTAYSAPNMMYPGWPPPSAWCPPAAQRLNGAPRYAGMLCGFAPSLGLAAGGMPASQTRSEGVPSPQVDQPASPPVGGDSAAEASDDAGLRDDGMNADEGSSEVGEEEGAPSSRSPSQVPQEPRTPPINHSSTSPFGKIPISLSFLEQLQSLFKWTSEPVWVGSVGGELGGATGKEVSAPKRAER